MGKKNKYLKLITDTGIFAVGNLLQKLVAFFLVPIYTSFLTTTEFGISDIVSSLSELAIPLVTLAVHEAIFRFAINKDENYKKLLSNGMFVFSNSILICLALGFIASNFFQIKYTWYFVSILLANSLRMIFAFYTRGTGRIKIFAISGIISAVTLCGSNIILLAVFHMGIEGHLISFFISRLSSAVFLFITTKLYKEISIKNVDLPYLKVMLVFSIPMIFHSSSAWLMNISARYIILLYKGVATVGLYSAAIKLPTIINTVSAIFSQAWQFKASLESGKKNRDVYYTNIFKVYSALLLLFTSLVLCFVPYISKMLLKGEFITAEIYLPLMLLTALLACYSIFFGAFYIALKRSKPLMFITILSAAVNVSLGFLFIPKLGIWGALIASNISYLLIIVVRMIDVSRFFTIKKDWVVIIPSFVGIGIQIFFMTTQIHNSVEYCLFSFFILTSIYIVYYKDSIKKFFSLCYNRFNKR